MPRMKIAATKSAHVAHDAAAKGDEQRAAIAARPRHLAKQFLHAGQRLMFFARLKKQHDRRFGKRARKASLHRAQMAGEVSTKTRRGSLPAMRWSCAGRATGGDRCPRPVVFSRRCVDSDGLHPSIVMEGNERVWDQAEGDYWDEFAG